MACGVAPCTVVCARLGRSFGSIGGAPEVCEYRYWLADAMHSTWSAERRLVATSGGKGKKQVNKIGKTKSQSGSDKNLSGLRAACHQLEETLDCVSSYRDLHDKQPYPAHLDGQKTG